MLSFGIIIGRLLDIFILLNTFSVMFFGGRMAFITNFQSSVELVDLLERYNLDKKTNIDKFLEDVEDDYTEWTVDKEAKIGDIVYFMCAKTSVDHMRSLRKNIIENYFDDDLLEFTESQFEKYKKYAGKIIAIGKLVSEPFQADSGYTKPYWRSPWYASVEELKLLKNPVDISQFRDFIKVSRTGAITRLSKAQEERLNNLIGRM